MECRNEIVRRVDNGVSRLSLTFGKNVIVLMEIWRGNSLGDHLLPWIGTILEHSIYLLEEMPKGSQ